MCDFIPGLTVVMLYRGARTGPAKVVRIAGVRGRSTPTEIPAQLLTPLDPIRGHVLGELTGGSTTLPPLGLPKQHTWYGLPMGLPKEVEEAMGIDTVLWGVPTNFSERFLGIPGPSSAEAVELIRISTQHGRLAYEAAVERLELLERVGLDPATGLLNRESLMRQLTHLTDVDGVGCGVVLIGFGGLRGVIHGHGLNGWSRLMRQYGERITGFQSDFCPGAFSARLADDMIALVLPGQPGSTSRAVALLNERLAEPMVLDGTPIGVPTAFGTAGPADGPSAVEQVDAAARRLLSTSVSTRAAK